MFERFTSQARSVAVRAQSEARELGHHHVGTQHVLLGLLGEAESAGGRVLHELGVRRGDVRAEVERTFVREPTGFSDEDADALQSLGIDLDEIRRTMEEAFGPGALERGLRRRPGRGRGHIPFTPGAKKALELSLREALHLGHSYIGTEHVLLGLVRDEARSAARMLLTRGIDRKRVREAVLREVAAGGDSPGRTA